MTAHSQQLAELEGKESRNGIFSSLNCCSQQPEPLITIPVVSPTLYGNRIIFHNIELETNKVHPQPRITANLGDLTTDQFYELNNRNMLSGFNQRFNLLKENFNQENMEDYQEEELEENNPERPLLGNKNEEHETSSNIDQLFEDVSIDHVESQPVCNFLGNMFKKNKQGNTKNPFANNEMFRLTGAMNSFLDPPKFVDMETIESGQYNVNPFARCMNPLRNKFNNNAHYQKLTSLISQNTLNPVEVGCFGSCTKKLKEFVDVDNLTTMATTSTFGLKNLYQSFSSFPQNGLSEKTQTFFEALPTNFFQETNTFTKFFTMENANQRSRENFDAPLNTPKDTKLRPKYKNLNPNTFRLHAVEIHQYVPLPNMPSSRFVNEKAANEQFKANADAHLANCFFNPNTTGPVAPTMGNLMSGLNGFPAVYSNNKGTRLNTQDLSMCKLPFQNSLGSHNQSPLRVVE